VIAEITVVAVIAETAVRAVSAVSAEKELLEKEARNNHVNA
jgi:hypothetical protein